MKLTIKDRVVLPDILPEQGTMLDMLLVRSLTDKVTLTAKEITEWEVRQEGNTLQWNDKKATEIDIPLEASEVEFLKVCYRRLDEDKGITQRLFPLCLKLRDL